MKADNFNEKDICLMKLSATIDVIVKTSLIKSPLLQTLLIPRNNVPTLKAMYNKELTSSLNTSQRAAVEKAMGNSITGM